ncbi:AraC family transcriptional regulator [Streptomyces sp. NPDC050610]|uniref:helix-turn-helix domain-containing protein n=1 Tax=Streptomyces sp. NPDC050610 TaxID=3157097 RepID=UPI00342E3CC0
MPGLLPFAVGSFDTIGPMSRADFPHRHTFYEIAYVTGGTGHHVVDLVRLPLVPPHLCLISPGQVHYWERATGLRGWVILFTDDFLLGHGRDRQLLRRLGERPWLCLDGEEADRLTALVLDMRREFGQRAEGFVSVLQAHLHVLLTRAVRISGERLPETETGRASMVSQEFTRLLSLPGAAEQAVGTLAAQLGVSVGYLNEAVKQSTGLTPGRLTRAARTLEAKRLLASTDLTVGQVARQAGFADPAYFCRFFRRETGVSPGDFRREAHGNHHVHRIESIDPSGLPA